MVSQSSESKNGLHSGGEIVCPRCGRRGTVEVAKVNGRSYYRVRHYDSSTKKKFYHYLGPVEGYIVPGKIQGVLVSNFMNWQPDVLVYSIISTAKLLYEYSSMNPRDLKNIILRLRNQLEKGIVELDELIKEMEEENTDNDNLLEAKD